MKNMKDKLWHKLIKNINVSVLSAFSTCFILAIVICLIYKFVPQELNINLIKANFHAPINVFVAEQAERVSYITSLVLLIPIFSFFYLLFFHRTRIVNSITFLNKFNDFVSLSCLLFLILLAVILVFFYQYFIFIPCIFLACLLFYCKEKAVFKTKKIVICYVVFAILYLAKVIFLYFSKEITDVYYELYHFSAFAYPIFKVGNGLTLSVDFNNIYGYYPYFYMFLSKILGAWTVNKVLYFNIFLLTSCWLMMGIVINKFIKNKMYAFISFILFIFLTGGNGIYYLQTFPLRIINFVFIWVIASCFLFTNGRRKFLFMLFGFAGLCLGIVWNSESGLISLIAWTVFLIYYQALIDTVKSKNFYKKSLIFILFFIITLTVSAFIYLSIAYFRTGKFVYWKDIFMGADLFYKSGFYMIKITPYHPWFVPLIIYFVALIFALNPVLQYKKSRKPFLPFLFLTSLIGFGFYIYYQGRSHITCLTGVLFPIPLIIGLFIDRLQHIIKLFAVNKNLSIFYRSLKLWNFILCTSVFSCFFFVCYKNIEAKNNIDENSLYNSHKEFIEGLKNENNVLILAGGAPVFYEMLGIKDNFPFPPVEDLILKKDYDKILTYIEQNNNSIVFTEYWLKMFEEYDLPRLNKILEKREKIVNPPIVFYRYRGGN